MAVSVVLTADSSAGFLFAPFLATLCTLLGTATATDPLTIIIYNFEASLATV